MYMPLARGCISTRPAQDPRCDRLCLSRMGPASVIGGLRVARRNVASFGIASWGLDLSGAGHHHIHGCPRRVSLAAPDTSGAGRVPAWHYTWVTQPWGRIPQHATSSQQRRITLNAINADDPAGPGKASHHDPANPQRPAVDPGLIYSPNTPIANGIFPHSTLSSIPIAPFLRTPHFPACLLQPSDCSPRMAR